MKKVNNIFILIVVVLAACNPKLNIEEMNTDRVEYNFQDSSVPPQYHRSYDIVITFDKATVTVNSYGTILADTSYALTKGQFQSLVMQTRILPQSGEDLTRGATGQKSHNIDLYEGENNYYSLYFDSLSKTSGNEKVNTFIESVKNLIPDLTELRNRPLKEDE